MNDRYATVIGSELNIPGRQVQAAIRLLEEGASVPFISRYRKEVTGSLDELAIAAIRDRAAQLEALDKRRESILHSLEEQGKLSEELKQQVFGAETLAALEDIYLPYRPKRRTRAAMARERGLEPLAALVLAQAPSLDPAAEAAAFLDPEKGVSSPEEALAGARDIIAEWVNEHAAARAGLRDLFKEKALLQTLVVTGKEAEGSQYRDYHDWRERASDAPSHRVLAARRGETEGFLVLRIAPPEEEAHAILASLFLKGDSQAGRQVKLALHDGYKRLLAPSLETEMRQWTKARADEEAIRVFAANLRHLLMGAPLGSKNVMALDPGFRTGCKLACLDAQGKLLHNETVYPHTGDRAAAEAARRIPEIVGTFHIDAIAIGNGTAGRETETFIRALKLPESVQVVMVDESGASIYSASPTAREEFPDHDITVRGAVSIGRRLMDPLAELVKIDPKSLGVGQYQHDVDQSDLRKSLDDVVASCVNAVGVEANTASSQLLTYVSGLGPQLARNIVAYRDANGPFPSREALKKAPRLGPKAYQQAAGFLRIRDSSNPLDAGAVHPESYHIVEAMARDLGSSVADLLHNPELRKRIDLSRYVSETIGLPTLNDIMEELAKPGRDPREKFEPFSFAAGIEKMEDLEPGMRLPGIVTNVTAFGAFVDIGVHRDGMVHISEMADRFVKDPREVVHVHQRVSVTVLEIDAARKRISLSMKSGSRPERENQAKEPADAKFAKPAGQTKPAGAGKPNEKAKGAGAAGAGKSGRPAKTADAKPRKEERENKAAFHNPFAAAGLGDLLKKK